jgi:hypothetical protein
MCTPGFAPVREYSRSRPEKRGEGGGGGRGKRERERSVSSVYRTIKGKGGDGMIWVRGRNVLLRFLSSFYTHSSRLSYSHSSISLQFSHFHILPHTSILPSILPVVENRMAEGKLARITEGIYIYIYTSIYLYIYIYIWKHGQRKNGQNKRRNIYIYNI